MRALCLWLLACAPLYPAAESEFHIPFEKYKLANGLRVVLARDAAVPVAAVCAIYNVGSRDEDKSEAGFAHLLEHLMFDGSANVAKGEHVKLIEEAGGEASGSARFDYSLYSDVGPSNGLALALWLESDRMRGLRLTEESLKSRKDAVLAEIRNAYEKQPYRDALDAKLPPLLFTDFHDTHPVFGTPEDVNAATVDGLTQFFRAYYSPGNAVLVVSGDFTTADVKKTIDRYFADIPAQPPPGRATLSEPARAEGRTIAVRDEHARFAAAVVSWPAPKRHTPDWYALNTIDAILTAGRNSMLERELMQGRESVLQVDANLGWPWSEALDYKDPGYYSAMLVCRPNHTPQDVVEQYQQTIDSIAATGIEASELRHAKAVVKFQKASALQTALGRARLLGLSEAIDGDAGLAERDFAAMAAVTSAQIQAAAARYLTAARHDVLIVEPAGARK